VVHTKLVAQQNRHPSARPLRQRHRNRDGLIRLHLAGYAALLRRQSAFRQEYLGLGAIESMSIAAQYRSRRQRERKEAIRLGCVGAMVFAVVAGVAIAILHLLT
jgi:hypothetical protein